MNLTGVYGYGQLSIGFNAYILGGGIDIFVGAGAFATPLPGGPAASFVGAALLPYVVGTCGIYVHGEILGGLVSASAWANLSLRGPIPPTSKAPSACRDAWCGCCAPRSPSPPASTSSGLYLA